jgi:paraquat-inducible protein A
MTSLVACLECDLLHREAPLSGTSEASCVRCGAVLYRRKRENANEIALALTVAAIIFLLIANAFPIVTLETQGVHNESTLFGAVVALWNDQRELVAALVCVTTIAVPAAELLTLTYVLLVLRNRRSRRGVASLLHFLQAVKPWGMVEVFFLGVLVSLVKLTHIAAVTPGAALFSFAGLMFSLAAAASMFDTDSAWAEIEVNQ